MSDTDSGPDSVDYDPSTDTYHAQFTPGEDTISTVIVEALADVRRCEPTDLEPLYHSVDTDALDSLVASTSTGSVSVTATIDGFRVRIVTAGRIEITPPEGIQE